MKKHFQPKDSNVHEMEISESELENEKIETTKWTHVLHWIQLCDFTMRVVKSAFSLTMLHGK